MAEEELEKKAFEYRKEIEEQMQNLEKRICELQSDLARKKSKNKTTTKELEQLKEENTELKTRWQCRNKYICNNNGKGVPCYMYYGCLGCSLKSER